MTATDDTALPSLAPTDPLEVGGMKAGTSANDHGPFQAAARVATADRRDSVALTVPPDDLVDCPHPWPVSTYDVIYASVTTAAGDPLDLHVDVLTPHPDRHGDGPFPVVVFVPGGGFVISPKSGALIRRTAIAERGFVVVSAEYRTIRHGTWRDGVADVAAAVAWARANAGRFGGDGGRIALWGESAGGYLASLAVTSGAVAGVRGVVDVFGLTDLSCVAMDFDAHEQARHLTPAIPEAQYVFGRGSGRSIVDDPDEVQRANPVRYVSGDEPPFVLYHGEIDGLVSPGQTQLLHQALLAAGVASTRVVVEGAGHYGIEWCSATVLGSIGDHLAALLAPVANADSDGRRRRT